MRDCLEAALFYARKKGWKVFPLNGKLPFAGTHAYKDATTDLRQIRRWWKQWPDANVGIACDSQQGPIVVDVDGPSGWALIEDLALVDTRQATSGKKSKRHLYFDPTMDGKKIARMIRLKKDGVKMALDILGDGGYVVAPPSVHPDTGRRYAWISKRPMARFPRSLISLIKENLNGTTNGNGKHLPAEPLPEIIDHGERDNLLTSLAGSMRRRGASPSAILAALREENDTRVDPPLTDRELRKIAKSIGTKTPLAVIENLTDLGNARRFIKQHQLDVRSVMAQRRPWMLWDGSRWRTDDTGEVERLAKATVRSIWSEAEHVEDAEQQGELLKHAAQSESASRMRSLLELAATEPEISCTVDQFDSNPWLFNVANGTINLKTGKFLKPDRNHLLTKQSSIIYDATANAPRWGQFLLEIMAGDAELVQFLQTAVGYSLTGDTREQCLFFCYGRGSNGKTTFFEILRKLSGEYAKQSDFSSFMASKSEGPRNDLARMNGARIVTASEADAEKGFDGRIIKTLTGDDTIVARRLYEEFMEFKPQHKLWLAANHKPVVREQTEGFWRRIRLVPFDVRFAKSKRDKTLPKTLRDELPGILNWALAGTKRWLKEGLVEPAAVKRATKDYKAENDILGEFFEASCRLDPEQWSSTSALYRAFTDFWAATRGNRSSPIGMAWFGRLLGERQALKPAKRHHIRGWNGVQITAISQGDRIG
jgi:putative DNA primase/helicase